MNREIIFKAKGFDSNTLHDIWYFGNLTKMWNNKLQQYQYFITNNDLAKQIDPATICQLITKIDNKEKYEYDCFADSDGFIVFFHYNEFGTLVKKYYGKIVEIPNAFTYINYQYATNNEILIYAEKWQFIGNWHDGEEFLINNIKELGE